MMNWKLLRKSIWQSAGLYLLCWAIIAITTIIGIMSLIGSSNDKIIFWPLFTLVYLVFVAVNYTINNNKKDKKNEN